MFNQAKVASAVRWSLIVGISAGASITHTQAFAQDAAKDEKKVERIEVTGSRIKKTDMETAQPVFSIGQEDIARTGLLTVGDVLKEISTNGAALGLQTNNGNTSGVTRVNLRNCSSSRTLVLVNGRRWVADLNGAVDLGTIPLAAIKSVEVLKDGASSIYGTDAICGVVNVITKNDFDGVEFSAYNGETSYSDGKRENYAVTVGSTSEKSSVLLNVAYSKQEQIMGGDRAISSVPIYGLPANVSINGGRASPTTPYGQFSVAGVSRTLTPGKAGCVANKECTAATAADFKNYDGNTDGYNFAPVNYIQQPSESLSLYAQASYELADNVTWKAEIVFNERTGQAQLAAQPLGGLTIAANNMYNPFKVAIAGASFRPIVAPRQYNTEVDTWRATNILTGEFEAVGRTFTWDAAATYSDNSLVQLKEGFFHSTRFTTAIGPSFVNGQGVPTCGTAAAPIAGCVPFNLFGGPDGVNQAMLDYVSVAPRDLAYAKMWDYSANISTELFDLPAGAVQMAAGTEIRRESGFTSPEPLTVLGQVLGDNAATPTRGGFTLKEGYVEFSIPLLADLEYAKNLDLDVSTRYSDYSTFGDTQNSSYKISYRPNDELLIRASFNEGFRAPSIQELYQGMNDTRPTAIDPCSKPATGDIAADIRARCTAAGVPTTFVQKLPQIQAKAGGNPDLQPETSESKSVGFVYSPDFLDGFSFNLDWYNIAIKNIVGSYSAQRVLDGCYKEGDNKYCQLLTRDKTGALNANIGEIDYMALTNQNFKGGNEVEGVDFGFEYRFETSFGRFKFSNDNAYVIYDGSLNKLKRGELTLDGSLSGGNAVGLLSAGASGGGTSFRLKSNNTLAWSYEDWNASLTAIYLSRQVEVCTNVTGVAAGLNKPELRALCSNADNRRTEFTLVNGVPTAVPDQAYPINELPVTVYFDAQAGWASPWNSNITVGVRNLFDKEPPYAYSAFANTFDPNYRVPGRFYYVSFTQKF